MNRRNFFAMTVGALAAAALPAQAASGGLTIERIQELLDLRTIAGKPWPKIIWVTRAEMHGFFPIIPKTPRAEFTPITFTTGGAVNTSGFPSRMEEARTITTELPTWPAEDELRFNPRAHIVLFYRQHPELARPPRRAFDPFSTPYVPNPENAQ